LNLLPIWKLILLVFFHRNDTNCPVVLKGFVAYLIRNWGKREVEIYNSYYTLSFATFERSETKKPGSFERNLNPEFYPLHLAQENESINFSKQIKPYLSKPEIQQINQYIKAYFKYIEQVYSPKAIKDASSTKQIKENNLSVSDWCIIFYYMDEAGIKAGNKIDRIKKFIVDNSVVNPSGTLTTKSNFKKEYHEIENRINSKNDKKPLPPERIENILNYLKNNKKALKAAKSDIEHLTNEIEENKRNTY